MTTETFAARIDRLNLAAVTEARMESLAAAHEAGVTDDDLRRCATARRLYRSGTVRLPAGDYAHTSRGRDWCREGTGDGVVWGDRHEGGGFVVRAGRWSVGSTDGFERNSRKVWLVEHVAVGSDIWTIANA